MISSGAKQIVSNFLKRDRVPHHECMRYNKGDMRNGLEFFCQGSFPHMELARQSPWRLKFYLISNPKSILLFLRVLLNQGQKNLLPLEYNWYRNQASDLSQRELCIWLSCSSEGFLQLHLPLLPTIFSWLLIKYLYYIFTPILEGGTPLNQCFLNMSHHVSHLVYL